MPHRPMIQFSSQRRGSMYVAVIGCSLVITVIGVSALLAARVERRAAEGTSDFSVARLYARAAIEKGMYTILSNSAWRSTKVSGVWDNNQTFADGTYSLSVIDPIDGDLSDLKSEPVVLTGTGVLRNATYILEATAMGIPTPLSALGTCLHTGGSVTVESNKKIIVNGAPLSMNGTFNGPGTVTGNVEAGAEGIWAMVFGTKTIPSAAKSLPDASVVDLYIGLATAIANPEIIDKQVLTPGINPWGAANPDGLYFIDTGNKDLTIQSSRINGTLVVRCGAGKKVVLIDKVFLHAYRADYPALIVDGPLEITLKTSSNSLSESSENTNFNPPGAAYQGFTDSDRLDTYPNEVRGLVHVRGTLLMDQTAIVRGTVIAEGNVMVKGNSNQIIYDSALHSNPPMGYVDYMMQIAAGSWKRIVLP